MGYFLSGIRERMDWAKAGLGRGQDVAQAKLVVEDFREIYEKWHPVIQDPELRAGLEAAREGMVNHLARGLEKIFLSRSHDVIEARKDCPSDGERVSEGRVRGFEGKYA